MNYKYSTQFQYEGMTYRVRANSQEGLKLKKEAKLKELQNDNRILTNNTTVDVWAIRAYDTYKSAVKCLPEMKMRYWKYISPRIGQFPLKKVTALQCQEIVNGCAGMSYSHINKLKQELKFIFTSAVNNRLLRHNPAEHLTMPHYVKGSRRSITNHERKHLYLVAEQYKPFLLFILMLECGCRPSEAMGLIGRDIDHQNRLLHIRGTKTANSDRYVPIPDALYEKIKNTKPFDYIAPNNAGNMFNKDSYRRLSDRLKRELNISMGTLTHRNQLIPPYALSDDFTPYCLRHTYCTDLCKAGVDVRTAQRLMGHANISITADIYTHVDMGDIIRAGELIKSYKSV